MKAITLFSGRWILMTILALLATAACVRLGIWQLDRLAQRQALNAHVRAMLALPPLDLPASADLTSEAYRAVRAEGVFDFEHEIVIRNQLHDGAYGYDLVTPLRLGAAVAGSTQAAMSPAVLVDRGWIPADGNSTPADWHKYDSDSQVEVTGTIQLSEISPTLGGLAQPTPLPAAGSTPFWLYLDIGRIQGQLPYPVLPVYIQIDPGMGSGTAPIPNESAPDLTDGPHLGYAIQWFGFAGLVAVGYPLYVRRQENRTS
jgi:surfeit locus 1 family protein